MSTMLQQQQKRIFIMCATKSMIRVYKWHNISKGQFGNTIIIITANIHWMPQTVFSTLN